MSDDDQERFEDYLELERYIDDLQMGKAARLPQHLTPEQARIYRMAAQFCSASPNADEPSAQFVADLEARLLDELQQEPTEKRPAIKSQELRQPETAQIPPRVQQEEAVTPPPTQLAASAPPPTQPVELPRNNQPRRARFFSRRSLLAGGAVAAASLAVGAGVGAEMHQDKQADNKVAASSSPPAPSPSSVQSYGQPWLVQNGPNGIQTTWHFVTTLSQLGDQAVQFFAQGVVGYVILQKGDQKEQEPQNEVIAISAACTHMGCIVQWQNSDQLFHCPCHGGLFTRYGQPDDSGPIRYLSALPRIRVKVDSEKNIYVEVPKTEL